MRKSLGYVFNVRRSTATGKSQNIGDFKTVEEATEAMKNHYRETPKRGKFKYIIMEEQLEKIGSTIYRSFTMFGKRYYKKYTAEELKNEG